MRSQMSLLTDISRIQRTIPMKIRIVYDNQADAGLKSGWGFSCLIETQEKILFDTGDSGEKLKNGLRK